jgi:hypothetical protein
VAFAGFKGSGKDTAALVLIEEEGFEKVAFADALKTMLISYLTQRGEYPSTIGEMINGSLKEKDHYLLTPAQIGSDEGVAFMLDALLMFQGYSVKGIETTKLDAFIDDPLPQLENLSYRAFETSLKNWAKTLGEPHDLLSPRYVMQKLGTEWGRDMIAPDFWVNVTDRRCNMFEKVVLTDVRFPNEEVYVRSKDGLFIRVTRPDVRVDLTHVSEQHVPDFNPDVDIENDKTIMSLQVETITAFYEWFLARRNFA